MRWLNPLNPLIHLSFALLLVGVGITVWHAQHTLLFPTVIMLCVPVLATWVLVALHLRRAGTAPAVGVPPATEAGTEAHYAQIGRNIAAMAAEMTVIVDQSCELVRIAFPHIEQQEMAGNEAEVRRLLEGIRKGIQELPR